MHIAGLHSITLSDGARRLVWALPRGAFLPRAGGPTWDLDADATEPAKFRFRWADAVASLRDWLAGYAPPVLVDHRATLPGAEAFGVVTGVYEVTEAEARAAGVEQAGDALYLTIEPRADIAELFDAGGLPYTSPCLRADYTDDEGRHWPIILRELSFTNDPRQKRRQVPTTAAAPLAAALLSEVPVEEAEIEVKADPVAALSAIVEDLVARVVALESAKMADAPPAAEPVAEMSETAQLRRQLATLTAERDVDALLSDRELAPGARAHLIGLHAAGHAAAVKAIVAAAPKRGTTLTRAPLAGTAELSDATPEQRARALANAEKISLAEAWNRVSAQTRGA